MKFSGITARRHIAGIAPGCLLGGVAAATIATPTAVAAPEACTSVFTWYQFTSSAAAPGTKALVQAIGPERWDVRYEG